MKKENLFKSKVFKILFPVLAIVIAIALWYNGYHFGKWLHAIIN